jgi:hypothetical protein
MQIYTQIHAVLYNFVYTNLYIILIHMYHFVCYTNLYIPICINNNIWLK